MAINKERNVSFRVTMPKEDYEQLEVLVKAFRNNGMIVTKSKVLTHALKNFIKVLIAFDATKDDMQKEEN